MKWLNIVYCGVLRVSHRILLVVEENVKQSPVSVCRQWLVAQRRACFTWF